MAKQTPSEGASFRSEVIGLLRAIAAGRPVHDEEMQRIRQAGYAYRPSVPARIVLRDPLQIAWLELCQWVSDEDIRESDGAYAEVRRERLKHLLAQIEGELDPPTDKT